MATTETVIPEQVDQFDPRTIFQRTRAITKAVIKLKPGQTRWLALLGLMHVGKQLDDQKGPALLMDAFDMVSGEEGQIIVPKVMEKELKEFYPGGEYVGRGFEVTLTRVAEKRYNIVSISEVSVPPNIQAIIDKLSKPASKAPGKAR